MTISEYAKIEEQFKSDTLGKSIDYDGEYGGQCWDLAEYYFVNYLNIPASVLAGCGVVNNMLYPPKINELLQYFDEVDIHNMIKGDVVIWDWGKDLGHIAIFDNCPDGYNCYFVTQNNPVPNLTTLSVLSQDCSHAFRIKGITPDIEPTPEPEPINPDYLLDLVRRTIRGDYGNGQERIDALGDLYNEVQYQVDQNIAFGLTNWDDIRLF